MRERMRRLTTFPRCDVTDIQRMTSAPSHPCHWHCGNYCFINLIIECHVSSMPAFPVKYYRFDYVVYNNMMWRVIIIIIVVVVGIIICTPPSISISTSLAVTRVKDLSSLLVSADDILVCWCHLFSPSPTWNFWRDSTVVADEALATRNRPESSI
jgi:hypothetical protein